MKKFLLVFFLAISLVTSSYADTHVNGYYKKNGTYVEPHYRTAPNSTNLDNYSTKGNINPYTGKEGTKTPESIERLQPQVHQYQYIEPMKPNNAQD